MPVSNMVHMTRISTMKRVEESGNVECTILGWVQTSRFQSFSATSVIWNVVSNMHI